MAATGAATMVSASSLEADRIADEWASALLTHDPTVVEALPWGYPQIAASEREDISRAVLDRLIAEDPTLSAEVLDPAVPADVRQTRYDHALSMLVSLMFDRATLLERVQEEATAPYEDAFAALPSPGLDATNGLVDAVKKDVEALANVPTTIVNALSSDAARKAESLGGPGVVTVAPLPSFDGLVPVDAGFAVCWLSAGDQGCAEIAPLAPMPVDVNGDALPDVLVTLSVLVGPSDVLALADDATLAPQISFRAERLGLQGDLQVLLLGLFSVDGATLVAGYDAFTEDAPPAARYAPKSITILANAVAGDDDTRAGVLFQPTGAGQALRAIGGVADSPADAFDPAKLLTLDTSPVPSALEIDLHTWDDADGSHFEGRMELNGQTDLVVGIREREDSRLTVARLTADAVGPTLALRIDRSDESESWDWEAAAPLARLVYDEETTTGSKWRRQSIELTDIPAQLGVEVPVVGEVVVQASAAIGSVRHIRHQHDAATLVEKYHAVGATGIPASVAFTIDSISGSYQSSGVMSSLSFQSARADGSPAPGGVAAVLFDLSAISTSFLGLREQAQASAMAVQLVGLPESIAFTLADTTRGIDLDLAMSRGLGPVHGVVEIGDQRGILYLSNIPKDISIHADFAAATVTAGYVASSGIAEAMVTFTDLSLAPEGTIAHAYVQLLQLPREVTLSVTRAGEAPQIAYNAITSTADIRALVHEDLFGGDMKTRLSLWVDDLGASTTLSLVKVAGRDTLRLVSQPATRLIFVEGFVTQGFVGSLNKHTGDDCCWGAFGYDIWYGYNVNAKVTVQNLRLRLENVAQLEFQLGAPDLTVSGTFTDFLVAWDTISLLGTSSAWLRVDITVFWIDINVWNWGWSSNSLYNLNLQIVRYADQWGPLASVSIPPCSLSLNVKPSAVESMTNGFRVSGLTGQKQYLSVNPLDAQGRPAVPPVLLAGYMAWKYGGFSVSFGC